MKEPLNFYFVAGEPSGDLHGGKLLHALKKSDPDLIAHGIGGPLLREEGITPFFKMEELEVMGLSDVLKAFPRLWRLFRKVKKHILSLNPDLVILIDYPGFNLRLAKALRKAGYKGKIVQYVSPTIWAHSVQRIEHMASTLDLLLTIYPFEPPYFSNSSLPVEYVGNPLVEYIHNHHYDDNWQQELKLDPERPVMALFPGSRRSEILSHLPVLLKAVEKLKESDPSLQFAISCARPENQSLIEKIFAHSPLKEGYDLYVIPKKYTYELMRDSVSAIAKSGTVTLELALHTCPTLVIYNLTWINWLYAKWILNLRLRHYCIVNILQGKEIFPELIKNGFSISNIARAAQGLLRGPEREDCLAACSHLKEVLSDSQASMTAARQVLSLCEPSYEDRLV